MQSCSYSARHGTRTAGQAPCSIGKSIPNLSCSRNQLVSPFPLAASSVWASPWLENLLSSRFRAGVWHCQHLHRRDAGSGPLCLDFQVGQSSGPICSSPSLIIPVVMIPLISRQLEGKRIPHLSTAREQEVQGLPGEQQEQAVPKAPILSEPSDKGCNVCTAQFQLSHSGQAGKCSTHPGTSCGGRSLHRE